MLKQIRVWTGNCTIQRKTRKETRHAYVLVWRYKDTNLIMWSCLCDHQPGPACARKIQIETTLRAKDYPAQTIVFGGKRVVSTKKSAGKNHFSVCASDVMELLPVWRHNKLKTKKKEWASLLNLSFQERSFQKKKLVPIAIVLLAHLWPYSFVCFVWLLLRLHLCAFLM